MSLFCDPQGQAGFALKAEEIVSVYCHRGRSGRRTLRTLMAFATRLGGKHLNAFDTQLVSLYSECGFGAVARLPWDDRFAPTDWDYSAMSKYSAGRPDIVFMNFGTNVPIRYVSSFDAGIRRQLMVSRLMFGGN